MDELEMIEKVTNKLMKQCLYEVEDICRIEGNVVWNQEVIAQLTVALYNSRMKFFTEFKVKG